MISKETAHKIWNAHNEIEKANNLIKELKKAIKEHGDLLIPDSFGERRGLQLSVPSSSSSWSLFNVPPELSLYLIEGHISANQKILTELMGIAKVELK